MIRVGFFGKMPLAGDFVLRGLSVAERQFWDRWLTRHLGFAFGPDVGWPEGGLWVSGPGEVGVIVQSRDRSGRCFPLLGLVVHECGTLAPVQAELWADRLWPHLDNAGAGDLSVQGLEDAFRSVALKEVEGAGDGMTLWARGMAPLSCADGISQAELARFFVK